MSSPTFDASPPPKPWRDFIHDVKNKINPAVQITENYSNDANKPQSIAQMKSLGMILEEINQSNMADLNTYKYAEPTETEQSRKKEQLITLTDRALKQAEEYLETVTERGEYDSTLISSIRNTQRYLMNQPESVLLNELIKAETSTTSLAFRDKNNEISFSFTPPGLETTVKAERVNYINSILENCLANSNRFTQNGKIEIAIKLIDDSRSFQIVINDNGAGMPPSILNQVRNGIVGVTDGGNGVGLAGVYAVTKSFQGDMSIESTTDSARHGTTFTWTLPAESILENTIIRNPNVTPSATAASSPTSSSSAPAASAEKRPRIPNRMLFTLLMIFR